MPWVYDPRTFNYRDDETGRFVSSADVIEISSLALDRTLPIAVQLASLLATDQLALRDWEILMREEIKSVYISQYLLGRGGLNRMTQRDWGSIGGMLKRQYQYLNRFSREIARGTLTQGQIAARSQMYFNSARQAFSRGRARAMQWDRLPAYPGDGSTICLTNCRCHWERDGKHTYRWVLDYEAEHCSAPGVMDKRGRPIGCIERAEKWSPYVVE